MGKNIYRVVNNNEISLKLTVTLIYLPLVITEIDRFHIVVE